MRNSHREQNHSIQEEQSHLTNKPTLDLLAVNQNLEPTYYFSIRIAYNSLKRLELSRQQKREGGGDGGGGKYRGS